MALTCYKLQRADTLHHRQTEHGMVLSFVKIQLTQPSIRWIHKDQGENLLCMWESVMCNHVNLLFEKKPRYAVVIIWSSGNYKYLEPRNYFYEWHRGNNSFRNVIGLSTDFSDPLILRRPGKKEVFFSDKIGKGPWNRIVNLCPQILLKGLQVKLHNDVHLV